MLALRAVPLPTQPSHRPALPPFAGLQEGGTAYGFGETTAAGGPPAGTASVAAAAAHHGGYADLAQHAQQGTHPKRKMSEMGEVGDQSSPGMAAAAGGSRGVEEVQECDMEQASGGPQRRALGGERGRGRRRWRRVQPVRRRRRQGAAAKRWRRACALLLAARSCLHAPLPCLPGAGYRLTWPWCLETPRLAPQFPTWPPTLAPAR